MNAPAHNSSGRSRLRDGLVLAIAMLVLIAAGSLGLQRWVAETKTAAVALSVLWGGLVAVPFLLVSRRSRDRLIPVGAALLISGLVAGIGYWHFSVRDTRVDEDVVVASASATGAMRDAALRGDAGGADEAGSPGASESTGRPVRLASGTFTGADGHSGQGKATIIQIPSGERRLTFTDFDVDPGAAVEVYLVAGDGSDVSDRVELGDLKGNVGDQEYGIPATADLRRYRTVVLWCTPFTVRIAVAPLS